MPECSTHIYNPVLTANTVWCKLLILVSTLRKSLYVSLKKKNISFCRDFSLLSLWCSMKYVNLCTLEWLRVYRNLSAPVPPAIIPTCLNFRTFGSDFLSGRMENWPDQESVRFSISRPMCFAAQVALTVLYCTTVTSAGGSSLTKIKCFHYSFILYLSFFSLCTHTIPFPWYTSSPLGPLKSMLSPIAMLSRYWDIFPPSGKEGWQFL